MPFPHHDPAWAAVAAHLEAEVRDGEHVVAPDVFWVLLPVLHRYRDTWDRPDVDPDWLIVHKGEVDRLEPGVLERAERDRPVRLANDVFVVLGPARLDDDEAVDPTSVHVAALRQLMSTRGAIPPTDDEDDPVLPRVGVIERFDRFDLPTMKAAMDSFYESGGYDYPTQRDRVYDGELDRLLRELVGPGDGRRRLDLASGLGRTARVVGTDGLVLSDLSEVGLRACRRDHPGVPAVAMDACRTAIRSGSIDDVVFSDAFEHVHDPAAAFAEAARVLRPDGRLFVTANNKNSLNLRLTRALGHPDFVTNYQHITELAYEDLVAMLDAAHFDVATSRGLFLFPYWGVPGVDEHVRHVIDDDPEIVEVSRELGELVGARHAFVSVVSAVRR
jgi:SAM-dependent methyltransferase